MSTNQAAIVARMGASGSGKSLDVKTWLRAMDAPRRLIWDTMNEYAEHAEQVPTLAAMVERMRAGKAWRLRYVPSGDPKKLAERFDVFCAAAFAAGDVVVVVEELQTVTSPSWAPAAWSDCTLRGRHRGLVIIGVSQRPASVDKNFFSNATLIRSGRLNFAADVSCMANVLHVEPEQISALVPLAYIERDMTTGKPGDGVVPLPGAVRVAPAKAKKQVARKKKNRRSRAG